jgi:hypothetical protein
MNIKDLNEGCCSIIVQATNNHNVVAFRRDSKYPAELIITKKIFHGKNAEVQYKINGGLFHHTVITSDGWIIGIGGRGTIYNHELLSLAGQIMENGINQDSMEKAQSILTKMCVGHFLIKSPDNYVGCIIQFKENTLNKLFKMHDGEFICVPNAPKYYREGNYTEFNGNPLTAAAKIAGTDLWGVNRRDVIFHNVEKNANNTMLQIWASFDNGSLINRNHGKGGPDDIQFLKNQIIYGKNLPIIPDMTKIGEIELLDNETGSPEQFTFKDII